MDAVALAINHPIRRRLIEAMWHNAKPLSPLRFHAEYVDPDMVTLAQVIYHARQLEKDEIMRLDGGETGEVYERRCLVLDGPNSADAIRRLRL